MNQAQCSRGPESLRPRAHPPRTPKFRLREDEVDLWRVALDAMTPEAVTYLEALLSPDETQRMHRFFFERDRRRMLVARGMLRLLLSVYTGRPAASLRFSYGPHGKPALALDAGERAIFFNVAHAEELAVFAFTPAGEVGIDVEHIRELPEWEAIAASCFSPAEVARVRQTPADRRSQAFLAAWTRHEAALKASGFGLTGDGPTSDRTAQGCATPAGYRVCELDVSPHYVAALAAPPNLRQATLRTWPQDAAADESSLVLSARRVSLERPVSELSFP